MVWTVSLSIRYSKDAFGVEFSRSRSIVEGTNDTMKIYRVCHELFDEFYDGRPTRQISVSLSKLEGKTNLQLSLFEANKWRNRKLASAMDSIRSKYGSTALLRAVSYTDAGTARQRDQLIGGHKAE
ncbi:DinB/UmuC family translesion DNA polymerase [Paenisporosarcina antarctica]|uniref:DNA polymerase Y-family little finger domain-containing protein n=1 Tax=Paenisporosarcina antarctica TaxID=417367 RepID=A0A4P6ZV87_9BACL|nr:hypothetical protein [Paenisporosarcina antarctica]QBP39879.1 hypothetical protein E2636_01335 [Paenisporosarcina antarctica]